MKRIKIFIAILAILATFSLKGQTYAVVSVGYVDPSTVYPGDSIDVFFKWSPPVDDPNNPTSSFWIQDTTGSLVRIWSGAWATFNSLPSYNISGSMYYKIRLGIPVATPPGSAKISGSGSSAYVWITVLSRVTWVSNNVSQVKRSETLVDYQGREILDPEPGRPYIRVITYQDGSWESKRMIKITE